MSFFHAAGYSGSWYRKPDAHHCILELLAVFRCGDGFHAGTDEFHAISLQSARINQVFGEVKSRLAANSRKQGFRAFLRDDGFYNLGHQRLHIGGIGKAGVGHYRGRVGVGEDHSVALFPKHATGLNS